MGPQPPLGRPRGARDQPRRAGDGREGRRSPRRDRPGPRRLVRRCRHERRGHGRVLDRRLRAARARQHGRHGPRPGRHVDRRPAAGDRPAGLVRPGHPRDQVRDDRRRHRGRRPRQGPPRHRQPRRPRAVHGPRPARRHPPHAHAPRPPRRVLGHLRRHGADRHGDRGHDRPAPHRDQPALGRQRPRARPRHAAGAAVRGWAPPPLLGGVGRPAGPGPVARPFGPHAGRLRHGGRRAGAAAAGPCPPGVLGAAHDHGAAGRAERGPQPAEHPGVQRALVPQGPALAARRAPVDRQVLLPARHGARLEPHVRPPRLPAVAVPGALRGGGGAARASSRRCPTTRRPASCRC